MIWWVDLLICIFLGRICNLWPSSFAGFIGINVLHFPLTGNLGVKILLGKLAVGAHTDQNKNRHSDTEHTFKCIIIGCSIVFIYFLLGRGEKQECELAHILYLYALLHSKNYIQYIWSKMFGIQFKLSCCSLLLYASVCQALCGSESSRPWILPAITLEKWTHCWLCDCLCHGKLWVTIANRHNDRRNRLQHIGSKAWDSWDIFWQTYGLQILGLRLLAWFASISFNNL